MTLIDFGNGRLRVEDGCPRCGEDIVVGPPHHTVTAGDLDEASVRPNVLCGCGAELDIQQGRVWYRGQLSFPPDRDVRELDTLPDRVAAPIEVRVHEDEPDEPTEDDVEVETPEPTKDETGMTAVALPAWVGENKDGEPCSLCVDRYESEEMPDEPCSYHTE